MGKCKRFLLSSQLILTVREGDKTIAKNFNFTPLSLATITKHETHVEATVLSGVRAGTLKRVRAVQNENLEETMKMWIGQVRSKNLPYDGVTQ